MEHSTSADRHEGQDWDAADAALSKWKNRPENARLQLVGTRLKILLAGKLAAASKLAKSTSDANPDSDVLQTNWHGAGCDTGVDQHGLAVAKTIAERANTAPKKEPGILDTLARAQFMNGLTNKPSLPSKKL